MTNSGSITPAASAMPATRIAMISEKKVMKMRAMKDIGDSCSIGETVQSVIAIARRAMRSRTESFSVALLSWPQAARMSRPRGVRTGEA